MHGKSFRMYYITRKYTMIQELIVYQKRAIKRARLGMLQIVFVMFLVFKSVCFTVLQQEWWGIYVVLGGLLGFFVYLAFFFYWTMRELKQPLFMLDKKGIWSKHHGLFTWDNITLVDKIDGPQPKHVWLFKKSRRHYLGIKLKDASLIKPLDGSLDEKLLIIQSNFFYDIVFSDFDTPSTEIVSFAHQFMK